MRSRSPRSGLLVGALLAVSPFCAAAAQADTYSIDREIFVSAFRLSVRQWCAGGAQDPLLAALNSSRSIVDRSMTDPVGRASVREALDTAYAVLTRTGGCSGLTRLRSQFVVDGFEGHVWNSTRGGLDGHEARGDNGLTIITRQVRLGPSRADRVEAQADFVFTTEGQHLIQGRYRVPVDAHNIDARWSALERIFGTQYPSLRVSTSGSGQTRQTTFRNPDTQDREIQMHALREDGKLFIIVDYKGFFER